MTKKNLKLIFSILGLIIAAIIYLTHPVVQSPLAPLASNTPPIKLASDSAVLVSPIPVGFTPAQVTKVVDGDTIDVQINGQKFTVRFIGIDTPETVDPRRPVGCFGKEASDETKKLLTGKTVLLEKDVSETDKYNRLLRYIYLPQQDGNLVFINDYLVREGFAKSSTYPPDVKYQARFLEGQQEAEQNNRGLWARCK